MSTKVHNHYHLVDESPWPFLVSTASLFLTLGAVLFFHFSVQSEFVCCMMSFSSLSSKLKPKVLYFGGSVLVNQVYSQYRQYSFQPIGIGKAKWNPDNYSISTQKIIKNLLIFMQDIDKDSVYDTMYAVLGNKDGHFSKNYGKVTSVINNMIYAYNKKNPNNLISEREFLNRFDFKYTDSELNFLDVNNRGTIMSNVAEILAPKILYNEKTNILLERCLFLEDKINLSGQKNPEYSVGLFLKTELETALVLYDSDLKITEENSLAKQFSDLIINEKLNINFLDKNILGMNIVIVASHDEQNTEIILNPDQVNLLIAQIKKLSLKYPDHFRNFDENSFLISEFKRTGNTDILNKGDFPVVRYYRPIKFYELNHDDKKFNYTFVYKTLLASLNLRQEKETTNKFFLDSANDNID